MLLKSFFANAISFLFCFTLFSGAGYSQSASYLDSLAGKFALQFQIDGLFRLSSFQGSTFSGKYNFTSRDVVRLGITLGITDVNRENTINEIDTTSTYYEDGNRDKLDIKINTQYIRYMSVDNDLSFFAGGGPFVRLFSSSDEYKRIRYGKEEDWIRDNDGFSVGLELILGIEWMFYDNMTLSAEYGISAGYSKSDYKEVQDETILETTSKSYNLDYNMIKFGLSVYF